MTLQIADVELGDDLLGEVAKRLAEGAEANDRSGEFPWAGIQVVHDAGLLRVGIGSAYAEFGYGEAGLAGGRADLGGGQARLGGVQGEFSWQARLGGGQDEFGGQAGSGVGRAGIGIGRSEFDSSRAEVGGERAGLVNAYAEPGLRPGPGIAHGTKDLSSVDSVRLFKALGAGDPSVALLTAMTVFQHQAQARAPWWPDDLYRQVVADSYERPVLLNAIRAEPEWGAPARGGLPATTATKVDGGWIINGRKGFATGSEGLAYHLVWATTATDPETDPLLAHAIVPATSPGIEVIRTWDHLGLRASSTHDVVYTDVFIPEENFRGVPLSQQKNDVPAHLGLGLAALYVGVARSAQAWFVKFANERVPTSLGRPIATTERIQSVAGEIEVQLIQAEEVLLGLAAQSDAGILLGHRPLVAKLIATRSAVSAVQTAVAALGNPALTRHHPLERHLRDVLCSRVHPPQDDAALLIAGRTSLKR